MKNKATEGIRERVLGLIESESESDAAFEREFGLPEKTINNWRRGRSSSFMKLLPELSEKFKMNIGELMDMPLRHDTSELSEEELQLLKLYRKSRSMPEYMRSALRETLETTINLYITTHNEFKSSPKRPGAKKKSE